MGADPQPPANASSAASPVVGGPDESLERVRRRAGAELQGVVEDLGARYPEREGLLAQAVLALISREHLLIFGPPGTGKSEIATRLLHRVADNRGATSVFSRQIVETTVQADLVGPVDFKVLTETGRTVHRVDEGILSADFAILDEAFDGRDLLLRSILSVLNERALALGNQVVKAKLACCFLTTNRYLPELLAARPETLLAFCDRIAFSSFVPKEFASDESRTALLEGAAGRSRAGAERRMPLTDLEALQTAARSVEVSPVTLRGLAALVEEYERARAEATTELKGYIATTYFSPRTLAKAVGVLRAAVVRDRYVAGTDRPLRADLEDLSSLSAMFVSGGPSLEDLSTLIARSRDRRERLQLEAVHAERSAFDKAFEHMVLAVRRAAQAEAEEVELPSLRRLSREGPSRAFDLTLAVDAALGRTRTPEVRAELLRLSSEAAARFADALAAGHMVDPPSSDRLHRVRGYVTLARSLPGGPAGQEAVSRVTKAGLSEARSALAGVVSAYAVEEFEDNAEATASDVGDRVAEVEAQVSGIVASARELEARLVAEVPKAPLDEKGQVRAADEKPDEIELLAAAARKAAAATLRRRAARAAMRSVGQLPHVDPWRALAATSKVLARIDESLARLSVAEATARATSLAASCGPVVATEVENCAPVRLEGLAEAMERAAEHMGALGVDARAVFSHEWPLIERKIERWTLGRPEPGPPAVGDPSEQGYLQLLERCRAVQDRRALARLTRVFGPHPLLARTDALLARADLRELEEQATFLSRWFEVIARSVPAPHELATTAEAEAAWKTVSSSRFFQVGWRDNDLAALRERIAGYRDTPDLAADVERAAHGVDALAERARRFAQALLDRRAEFAP